MGKKSRAKRKKQTGGDMSDVYRMAIDDAFMKAIT